MRSSETTEPLVLVVEGVDHRRAFLERSLAADRFTVVAVGSVREARSALSTSPPQALLVDLDLPDAQGFQLLREVRSGSPEHRWDPGMPIVGLSDARTAHDVVRAIEQGADDHLARPFHYSELLARLRGAVRRCAGATICDEVRVGALVVDRRSRRATLYGQTVDLSAKEFALLDALARDPHRVLTKQELLRDVWGYISTGRTRTVDSHASRLRRKLERCGAGQRFVANVWGVGYRLLPEAA